MGCRVGRSASLRSKTVPISAPEAQFLKPVLRELAARPGSVQLLGMSYLQHLKVFTAAKVIGVPLTPSLGWHSGASIDAAANRRSLLEIQHMGRWKASKSVRRYEKMGRLNRSWQRLSQSQQDYAETSSRQLERAFLYHELPTACIPQPILHR